jgi:hypothetical protein
MSDWKEYEIRDNEIEWWLSKKTNEPLNENEAIALLVQLINGDLTIDQLRIEILEDLGERAESYEPDDRPQDI